MRFDASMLKPLHGSLLPAGLLLRLAR